MRVFLSPVVLVSLYMLLMTAGVRSACMVQPDGNGHVELQKGLKSIRQSAFYKCPGVYSMTIPDSVTSIGAFALDGLQFTELDLPSGLVTIGRNSFYGCSKLKSLIIPPKIKIIYQFTFRDTWAMEEITIPASVTQIDKGAFWNCNSLHTINIRSYVTLGPDNFNIGPCRNKMVVGANVCDCGTCNPTKSPTARPTKRPTTSQPTKYPTMRPTRRPTTSAPTRPPQTSAPTIAPQSSAPTRIPTSTPTTFPTSHFPTTSPTHHPTISLPPTLSAPSSAPTHLPSSSSPSFSPSTSPNFPSSSVAQTSISSTTDSIVSTAQPAASVSSSSLAGPITGAVFGVLIMCGIVFAVLVFWRRKDNSKKRSNAKASATPPDNGVTRSATLQGMRTVPRAFASMSSHVTHNSSFDPTLVTSTNRSGNVNSSNDHSFADEMYDSIEKYDAVEQYETVDERGDMYEVVDNPYSLPEFANTPPRKNPSAAINPGLRSSSLIVDDMYEVPLEKQSSKTKPSYKSTPINGIEYQMSDEQTADSVHEYYANDAKQAIDYSTPEAVRTGGEDYATRKSLQQMQMQAQQSYNGVHEEGYSSLDATRRKRMSSTESDLSLGSVTATSRRSVDLLAGTDLEGFNDA